jgi:ABC-2 type transport system permease protein
MAAFAYETWYLGWRALRRFYRVPANPISILAFPLIQLFVFSQLFRDIVRLPGFGAETSYLAYLAPGQIVFTVFLAVSWSGATLLADYRSGYLDKLRAAPIRRYAILAGELVPLAIECVAMAGIILALSVFMGASVATRIPGVILILALSAAFGIAWSGTSFIPALVTRNEQATGALSLLFFPIAFMSTAFVPAALMPEWLQALNVVNPISYVIEAMRALMTEGLDWMAVARALVAILALGAVLQGGTLWAFRRLTS